MHLNHDNTLKLVCILHLQASKQTFVSSISSSSSSRGGTGDLKEALRRQQVVRRSLVQNCEVMEACSKGLVHRLLNDIFKGRGRQKSTKTD